jgi:asparagine N-glycosylation enzyme membrane subunit Stt3
MNSNNQEQVPVDVLSQPDVTQSTAIPATPPVETVPENIFISFFDSHPRWALFLLISLINSFGWVLSGILRSTIPSSICGLFVTILIVVLAVTNYRNKRKDVLMLFVILLVLSAVVALVGLGFCLLMFGAFGH